MTDYRKDLYEGYVSRFKQYEGGATVEAEAYLAEKYFCHLGHLRPEAAVLEVGCGPGDVLAALKRRGFKRVEGIDVSAEQIELARQRGLVAACEDVFKFLDGQHGTYDAIIAIDFVEHFTKDELMRLFKLMSRALRADGILLVQTPNGEGLFPAQVIYGDLTHCTIFTPNSLAQALRHGGFDRFTFGETGPAGGTVKGQLRQAGWSLIKLVANTCRLIEAGKTQKVWTENLICSARKAGGETMDGAHA